MTTVKHPPSLKPQSRRQATMLISLAIMGSVILAGCTAKPVAVDPQVKAQLASLVAFPPELGVAQQYREALCLRGAGFSVPVSLTVPPPATSNNLSGIYGLFQSSAEAQKYGYSSSLNVAGAPVEDFRAGLSSADAKRFDQVQFGDQSNTVQYALPGGGEATTTTEGCFGEAVTAVYGSPEKYLELSSVQNILASQSKPGSELPPGVETYTRCMKDSGYTTTGITETLKMAADQFGASRPLGSTPAAPERELASADATCQLQAGFLDYYNAKFIEGAGAWITQNESWIAGANELKISALGNAKRILEDSGSAG